MAEITAALVKDLREKTGAGMMDCKNALTAVSGDIEAAIDWLRKKGLAKAAKKSGRVAAEGLVGVAVEANLGVVVEVNSETDFVARNDDSLAAARSPTLSPTQSPPSAKTSRCGASRRCTSTRASSAITSTARSPTVSAASACWSRWTRRATGTR